MNTEKPLIGERVQIDDRWYVIAGLDIGDRDVRVRAVALDGRHERIDVSFPQALKALVGQRSPRRSSR